MANILKKVLHGNLPTKKWTKTEVLTSFCLYFHVIAWGVYCGALSTTLMDLEQLTHTTTTQVALLFTSATAGALAGAPIGGLILSCTDCRAYMAVICLLFSCTITALPWSGSFVGLMSVSLINGIFQGALDSGQNVTALLIWGWDRALFMQAFHCVFAIGTFLGPFLTKGFLAPTWFEYRLVNGSENAYLGTNISITEDNYVVNATGNYTKQLVLGTSRAQFPFLIIGVYFLLCAMIYLVVFLFTRKERKGEVNEDRQKRRSDYKDKKGENRNPNQSKMWYMIPMLIMAFIRFASYVGLELTFSGFLMTFTVKILGWEKPQGLMATTVYWGSFAASRLASVFLVLLASPTVIAIADVCILLAAYLCMAFLVYVHPYVILVCAVAAGIAGGSFYGCSMSWAYRYIRVSERVGTVFCTGSWLGVLALPALSGYMIDHCPPLSFIYLCLGDSVLLATVTFAMTIMGLKYGAPSMVAAEVADGAEEPLKSMSPK